MTRRARLLRTGLAVLVALVAGVLVIPVGTWVDQQRDIEQAAAQLRDLRRENDVLEDNVARLGSRDSIEGRARRDFGLAQPGDETYAVAPALPPSVDLPDVWPFDRLEEPLTRAAR